MNYDHILLYHDSRATQAALNVVKLNLQIETCQLSTLIRNETNSLLMGQFTYDHLQHRISHLLEKFAFVLL